MSGDMPDVDRCLSATSTKRWRSNGRGVLLGAVVGIGAIWLGVLPVVGRLPVVRADIERVNAAGIDPSALYWTELDDDSVWDDRPLLGVRRPVSEARE